MNNQFDNNNFDNFNRDAGTNYNADYNNRANYNGNTPYSSNADYGNNAAYNNAAYSNNTGYNNTPYNNAGYGNNTGYNNVPNNTGYGNNAGYNNAPYNNTGYNNGFGSNAGNGYTNYTVNNGSVAYMQDAVDDDARLTECITKSFGFMFVALLLSALAAVYAAGSGLFVEMFATETGRTTWSLLLLAELVVVMFANACISKQKTVPAIIMFVVYSITNGLTLASLFYVYSMSSIIRVFFMTALLFGGMCAFGFFTKKSLSGIGHIGIMVLWGAILCSIVNLFLGSTGIDWLLSIATLTAFIGLTAWDTQKIKRMSYECPYLTTTTIGLFGALELYLDFINIFLRMLRLFARSRN